MSNLGKKLFESRRSHGYSLGDVARKSGLSKTHVWELERGSSTNPTISVLSRLADVLNVSLHALAYAAADDLKDQEHVMSAQLIARSEEIKRSLGCPVSIRKHVEKE